MRKRKWDGGERERAREKKNNSLKGCSMKIGKQCDL